jgi:hypothetical protein
MMLHFGHISFKYASRKSTRDSTELSFKRPLRSFTIIPPDEKYRSDSDDEAWMTRIRLAIVDKIGNRRLLHFQNVKIWCL